MQVDEIYWYPIFRWIAVCWLKWNATRFHMYPMMRHVWGDIVCRLLSGIFLNALRPRRNRRLCADDIFKCIFLHENVWISVEISLKFVPKGPINNIPALVQIMAWRRSGDKPLSEPMMVSLSTHICVTRPQWVNSHEVQFLNLRMLKLISISKRGHCTLHAALYRVMMWTRSSSV